jgi:geranylgeranyl diphosphate synthase type II
MSFDQFSRQYKPLLQKRLKEYVTFEVDDPRKELADALHYMIDAQGKRVRPLLSIATYQMFRPEDDMSKILPLSCAIELLHTYSLIHDDLPAMDNDDFRRGQPSCHKRFGEDIAILAGDTMNTLAFEIVARDLPSHFSAQSVNKVIQQMSTAVGVHGMIGGQVMDIKGHTEKKDESYLKKMHLLKTGAVLASCIELPALLCEANEKTYKTLSEFGKHLGLLFQIVDDILDKTGNEKELGKSIMKDQDQNKLTYVSVYGLEGAKKMAASEVKAANEAMNSLPQFNTQAFGSLLSFLATRTS